jgi:mRNA interferase MazF
VRCAGRRAEVAVDQIRVLSRARLTRKMAHLKGAEAEALRRLISEMYGQP